MLKMLAQNFVRTLGCVFYNFIMLSGKDAMFIWQTVQQRQNGIAVVVDVPAMTLVLRNCMLCGMLPSKQDQPMVSRYIIACLDRMSC